MSIVIIRQLALISQMTKIRAELQRTEGNVFVQVRNPNPVSTPVAQQYANWMQIADNIATDLPVPSTPAPEPESEPETPTIDEVLTESLPQFIKVSRWSRYIGLGSVGLRPSDYIRDNSILIHHQPNGNFWDLHQQAKHILKGLGFRLKRTTRDGYPLWIVSIPISVLTDKVFIESGLAAIEAEILRPTGIDPVAILNEIRERQFKETQDGIRNVKLGKDGVKDVIGDAVGAIVIFVTAYVGFIVGGV